MSISINDEVIQNMIESIKYLEKSLKPYTDHGDDTVRNFLTTTKMTKGLLGKNHVRMSVFLHHDLVRNRGYNLDGKEKEFGEFLMNTIGFGGKEFSDFHRNDHADSQEALHKFLLFGDRLETTRVSAMHKLSRDFDKSLGHSATDSMRDAGMMFGIAKYPQFIRLEDGTELPTKSYAVVRDPIPQDKNQKILATVGKDWTTLQAEELGAMLDPVAEKYPVEATGWVGDGQKIYLTLNAGDSQMIKRLRP